MKKKFWGGSKLKMSKNKLYGELYLNFNDQCRIPQYLEICEERRENQHVNTLNLRRKR